MAEPQTASALAQRYARLLIPDVVRIEPGRGGLPHMVIQHAGAIAEIYFQGAQVAQYVPPQSQPLLFLSSVSQCAMGKPIRGGVPLIFPWYGPHPGDPALPAHGFARTMEWKLRDVRKHANRLTVEFCLTDTPETRSIWPHAFELRSIVRVGKTLEMALLVRNTGTSDFKFEEAMHAYLAVGDVRRLRIRGLSNCEFLDRTQGGRRLRQDGAPFVISGETDRVYLRTTDPVRVCESNGRELTVAKSGSTSTVVWNPWVAKAKAIADFADDEWPHMLCVVTANVAEHAIVLAPGEHHTMSAIISAENTNRQMGR